MSQNLKLGMGLAWVYGFTQPLYVHGAYFNRRMLAIPSPKYCQRLLREAKREGEQSRHVTGASDHASGPAGEGGREGGRG